MSDEKTLSQIIEELFESRRKYERFAMLYIRGPQQAQDIVMESFADLWAHRAELDVARNPESYMLSIVKNRCLDHLRHMRIRRNAEASIKSDAEWELEMSIATLQAFDPEWLYDEEVRRRFKTALAEMPGDTRRMFVMNRFERKTYAEIAAETGVSVKTVEYRMSGALRMLRKRFGDMYIILAIFLLD